MLTPQEIFNKVYHHLSEQGKAARQSGSCRYLTMDGLKCAVGCLIPDSSYKKGFENKGVFDLFLYNPSLADEMGVSLLDDSVELLSALQYNHDVHLTSDIQLWKEGMERTAKEFGLEIPE